MSRKNYWAVIPAAGTGKRMQTDIPKQYLPLAGKTVIEYALSAFLEHPAIKGVVVAITDGDPYWEALTIPSAKPLLVASGGQERCYSVLNALEKLSRHAAANDWVLVHDAARPCLRSTDIDKLINALEGRQEGGLLGLPMADTVKKCNSSREVMTTLDRSNLWRALTPQMFQLSLLREALETSINSNQLVTDEASAIEHYGCRPLMVEGAADNIKITHPGDLELAELFIAKRIN